MNHGVGRTANGGIDPDRIFKGFPGQHFGQAQIFADHLDGAHARHMGQHIAARIHRRDGRVMGQRGAQGFSHAGHGRGRTHGVAGARRARHAGLGREEFVEADGAGFVRLVHLPDDGAGTDVLAFVLAVQHRPTGDHNGRDITAGRAHQQRRGGFVATGQQHHAIDRVTANGFFHIHARQIARQHGGRSQIGFAVGKHRELDRETTGLDHTAFDVLGDGPKVRIARRQFRPGVADTDDGFALELMIGNALVLHPAAVHETVFISAAKPLGRTQGRKFV